MSPPHDDRELTFSCFLLIRSVPGLWASLRERRSTGKKEERRQQTGDLVVGARRIPGKEEKLTSWRGCGGTLD